MKPSSTHPPIVNVAAYRFVELRDLPAVRDSLKRLCVRWQLKGTILLSGEGINLFVAGSRSGVEALLSGVRELVGDRKLNVKESVSDEIPFNRMLVKIKQEIIPFGAPGVDPTHYTSRRISPQQLKQWLDEGRPVRLLDTRNAFEVAVGTFSEALALPLEDFREFPAAAVQLPEELKRETVVTFCTGGIRCEKAAPYLEQQGFQEVYQLDGGILQYFAECGGDHFEGQCFVFDKRVALEPDLRVGGLQMCYRCQAILTAEEQEAESYEMGRSCPRCCVPDELQRAARIRERNAAIQRAASPLPGSIAYDNVRPISVPQRGDGLELMEFLESMHTHLSLADWETACREGRVTCRGQLVQPGRRMRAGERLEHLIPAVREPAVNAAIEVLDEDDALVVVDKPAPLPMHACGRFNRNTLSYILGQVYSPLRLRPVHRLDGDTTGVVLYTKARTYARQLNEQFKAGTIEKRYLVQVSGSPGDSEFACHTALADKPGVAGVRLPDAAGLPATTEFRVIGRAADGCCFLEARPVTGRTNQIRAHLWWLGLPVVGDAIYRSDRSIRPARLRAPGDAPLRLHALSITFDHPLTGERTERTAPPPSWFEG